MQTEPKTKRTRVSKKVPMQVVTMRLPADLVDDLKRIAPALGFPGYQALIRGYVSRCLREDMAAIDKAPFAELVESLRNAGVAEDVIAEAVAKAQGGDSTAGC